MVVHKSRNGGAISQCDSLVRPFSSPPNLEEHFKRSWRGLSALPCPSGHWSSQGPTTTPCPRRHVPWAACLAGCTSCNSEAGISGWRDHSCSGCQNEKALSTRLLQPQGVIQPESSCWASSRQTPLKIKTLGTLLWLLHVLEVKWKVEKYLHPREVCWSVGGLSESKPPVHQAQYWWDPEESRHPQAGAHPAFTGAGRVRTVTGWQLAG